MPAAIPKGTATKKVTNKTRDEPTHADKIPALAALLDGPVFLLNIEQEDNRPEH